MNNKLIILSYLLSSMIMTSSVSAQTDDLLTSISNDMAHFNEVATVTKQNEHYQPYIISVFQGKELEKLGILNLKEALSLVPGVDMATDNVNTQTPIFRGSNPLASGQSKLFIDGTLVNNVFFDAYSEYLSLPVEMIKRVEVVRGPGSKTDGVNAYAGSINVITYAEDFEGFESNDKLVFKYGSYDYKMGGFIKSYKAEDFKVFIDFFYQEDDKKLPAGLDGYSEGSMSSTALGIDNTALAQSGDAPLWLKNYSLGLNMTYKDFSIKARTLNHTQGSAYGINLALPQNDDRVKLPNHFLEFGYNKNINNLNIDIKAGLKYDSFDSKSKLGHDGIEFIDMYRFDKGDGVPTPVTFTDGIYGEHLASQRTLYQSAYLKYSGINNHIFTTGYRLLKEETIDMVSKLSNWETGAAQLVDYTETYPFFDKNAKRDTFIFSLQDEFQFSNNLNFIYGLNYEKTSYTDGVIDPRVSMVYQADRENIYKAIYSRSHRNASWQEMFTMNNHSRTGSTDLDPEKVEAFEVAHIKKFSSDIYLQTNVFYLKNKDQIHNTDPEYKNVVYTDIYGLEVEYKGYISAIDEFYINYSYVDGETCVDGEDTTDFLPNVAQHLAKAYYIYNFNNSLSISGVAKYIGSKNRASSDTRDKLKGYSTVDTSLRYKNKKYDYSLMLSAKNIFNANAKYPSAPNTYTADYAQERRNFLVSIVKSF